MTLSSIIFFLIGAICLWGGFATTLYIALKNESK